VCILHIKHIMSKSAAPDQRSATQGEGPGRIAMGGDFEVNTSNRHDDT